MSEKSSDINALKRADKIFIAEVAAHFVVRCVDNNCFADHQPLVELKHATTGTIYTLARNSKDARTFYLSSARTGRVIEDWLVCVT